MTVILPTPIEIDPRPCELCGLTIDRHQMVDDGEGPEFFCVDVPLDELTLDELERRAELRREEEFSAILARLEAMDDPSNRAPPRDEPEPYRPAQSTVHAFQHFTAVGDVGRIREWLADRPEDAPHLLALLGGPRMLKRTDIEDLKREFLPSAPQGEPPDNDYWQAPTEIPEGADAERITETSEADKPLILITPAGWTDEEPPAIDWLVDQRIPRGDVTTLHGDGAAGKTDSALQLGEACARRAPYRFGHEIAGGPVLILSAEEPQRDLRRRFWQHGKRDAFSPKDLADLHLWFPDDVAGAVFATPDRSGIMHPTSLFCSIEASITKIAPVLVIVDNVAATFTGNQNDRVMVRSYVNLWRRIARHPSRPAVLLLDHPSLSGLTNGTGRGGNMDWRNAVRSALYLRVPDDKAEADRGIRILETVKSNYAAPGKPVRLQWSDGGLTLEHAPSSLHRLAKDAECEDIFLRLLDERSAQGRHVSDKNGKNYAPAVFAEMTGSGGFTAKALAQAMDRLFTARKIALRNIRVDGKPRAIIDRTDANAPPTPKSPRQRAVYAPPSHTPTSRQPANTPRAPPPRPPITLARGQRHRPHRRHPCACAPGMTACSRCVLASN